VIDIRTMDGMPPCDYPPKVVYGSPQWYPTRQAHSEVHNVFLPSCCFLGGVSAEKTTESH
jgi:hypothetical protein